MCVHVHQVCFTDSYFVLYNEKKLQVVILSYAYLQRPLGPNVLVLHCSTLKKKKKKPLYPVRINRGSQDTLKKSYVIYTGVDLE